MDCSAGLARCMLAQGQSEQAHEHVTRLWNYLSEQGTKGIELPSLVYQTCASFFDAAGQHEKSRAVIASGYRDLIARAEKISNPEWRTSFLRNVIEHRTMLEMWQRNVTST
jgi:hypothetical protein